MLTLYCFGFIGLISEFDILDENTSTQGLPYDYKSVMHPNMFAFGGGSSKTIVPLMAIGRLSIGPYPTAVDMLHLNFLYCGGICNSYN